MYNLKLQMLHRVFPNYSVKDIIDILHDVSPDASKPFVMPDGVTRVRVPLSDRAKEDPVIAAFPSQFKMKRQTLQPEEYTIFRTVAESLGLVGEGVDEATSKLVDRWIDKAQRSHARKVGKLRTFLSGENQIPGFKRIFWMGAAFTPPDTGYGASNVIVVTDEGRLVQRVVSPHPDHPEARIDTVAELVELLRHGRHDMDISTHKTGLFNLNRRSKAYSNTVELTVDHVLATSEERTRRAMNICYHTIKRDYEGRLNLARWAICQALDPDVLRIMRGTQQTSTRNAEILTGGDEIVGLDFNSGSAGLDKAEARKQAIKSYPILAKYLLSDPKLLEVIDERRPLAKEIAKKLKTDVKSIGRLQGLTWQRAATSPSNPKRTISILLDLDDKFVPKNRVEFKALERLISHFDYSLFHREVDLNKLLETAIPGRNPYSLAKTLEKIVPDDVRDATAFLIEKLHVPAAILKLKKHCEENNLVWDCRYFRLQREMMADLDTSTSLTERFKISDKYHRNLQRYISHVVKIDRDVEWQTMIGEMSLPGNVVAREVNSSEWLKRIGLEESHCVGSYGRMILHSGPSKGTHVFLLEDDKGGRSTAQLKTSLREQKDKNGNISYKIKAKVIQNRAKQNAAPPSHLASAAMSLASEITKKDPSVFDAYVKAIAPVRHRHEHHRGLPLAIISSGYVPWNEAHMQDAWDALSHLLPRRVRKAGLDAFIESRDITDQIDFCIPANLSTGLDKRNLWDDFGPDLDYLLKTEEDVVQYPARMAPQEQPAPQDCDEMPF